MHGNKRTHRRTFQILSKSRSHPRRIKRFWSSLNSKIFKKMDIKTPKLSPKSKERNFMTYNVNRGSRSWKHQLDKAHPSTKGPVSSITTQKVHIMTQQHSHKDRVFMFVKEAENRGIPKNHIL